MMSQSPQTLDPGPYFFFFLGGGPLSAFKGSALNVPEGDLYVMVLHTDPLCITNGFTAYSSRCGVGVFGYGLGFRV